MDMVFCIKWWIHEKKPINIIPEEEAKKKHDAGKPYTVLLLENDVIKNIILLANGFVTVSFVDSDLKLYLTYNFLKKDENRLFLKGASYVEYKNGVKIESMDYNFFESGNVAMAKHNFLTNEFEEREGQFNVDSNWDRYPEFGKYDHLLKIERE